jgi:putative endonuclease
MIMRAMADTTRNIGKYGEDLASAYLESKDWLIFDRNYSFEKAEVDIVATDRNYIVFVEVKFRSDTYFGQPEDYVTPKKEENIKKAAEAWIYERKMETAVVRFDVISIVQKGNQAPQITHFEDAFR